MQQLLKKLETIPMSLNVIKTHAPKKCRVILYDRLPNSVETLFGSNNSVIILYQIHDKSGNNKNGIGHFSLVMRTPNSKKIRYFSSYGFKPEEEIHLTHSKGKLLKLLGKNYESNRVRFQDLQKTETCALHCLVRAYLWKIPQTKYLQLMKKIFLKTPDDIVSCLTLLLVLNELQ